MQHRIRKLNPEINPVTFKDGRWFEGQWSHGKKHGQGTFYVPPGHIFTGNYEKG